MWIMLAMHQLILSPILGLIYLLTTCSLVANIHLSKYSSRVWCPYNGFTALNRVRAFQSSNSRYQTCLILLIIALPSTDVPTVAAEKGLVHLQTWKLEAKTNKAKRMSHACIVLSTRISPTSSFLFFSAKRVWWRGYRWDPASVKKKKIRTNSRRVVSCPGWILSWVRSDDYTVKKKKSVEIVLMSVISNLFRVGSDLIIVQCLTCIRSSRNESRWRYLFLFFCLFYIQPLHYIHTGPP